MFVSFVKPNVAFVLEKLIFFATSAAIGYNVLIFFVLIIIFVFSGLKPNAIKSNAFSYANFFVSSKVRLGFE